MSDQITAELHHAKTQKDLDEWWQKSALPYIKEADDRKMTNVLLTRIADALDRAYPVPEVKTPGKLKPGVAEYHHEDPQTIELRQLRDGPKETPSH